MFKFQELITILFSGFHTIKPYLISIGHCLITEKNLDTVLIL